MNDVDWQALMWIGGTGTILFGLLAAVRWFPLDRFMRAPAEEAGRE